MSEDSLQDFGGNWTQIKLEIVRRYSVAYNKALLNKPSPDRPFRRVYIDAFAGTGYRTISTAPKGMLIPDEPAGVLPGSAELALQVQPPFDAFVFIELEGSKIIELEKLRARYPHQSIEIRQGDANEEIVRYCIVTSWAGTRAVAFLDPFATEVDWTTLVAIAETKAIDLWLLFPLMAVSRMAPLNREPEEAWKAHLTRIFGSDEWIKLYRPVVTQTLHGDVVSIRRDSIEDIAKWFNARLGTIFAGVAPVPKSLHNSKNSPMFLLCFAAGNERGVPIAIKIADHLLKNF